MNKINESIVHIFDNLENHVSFILENEKIKSISKNFYKILNFKEEELIGKEIKEFFLDEKEYLEFKKNMTINEQKIFKIKLKDKSGNVKTFKSVLVNLEINKNLLILYDISEKIKKETLNKILYEISNLAFRVKNLQELLEEIHKLLKEYIYAENFYISLIDESGDYIYFPYFVDLKDEKPTPRKRRGGITEYILERGEPTLLKREEIEKLREEGKLIFYGTCPEYYIGAPLRVFDKLIGVIALQSYDKDITYDEDDLNLISFLSKQISYVIERLKSENERTSLIKNIKGFVFTITLEREKIKIIEIEGNFEEITGYKKDEILKERNDLKSLIHKEDYEKIKKLFLDVYELKDKTLTEIFRIITKSGEIKWVSINLSILKIEIPEVKIVQGIITDITESIKTKEKFFETEAKYKRILDNSRDIIFRYAFYPKKGFEYINNIVTEITGYTPEEHYNDPDLFFKIVHPEDKILLQKIISGEIKDPIVLRFIRKDGKIVYLEQNNWFIKDKNGNVVAIEGIFRNVTKRKVLEESLKESEKRFRTLFENAPLGITLTSKNGEILYCNPKYEEIMGYKVDELKNKTWMELTYPEDIKEDLEKFNKLIKGELYSYSVEKRAIRKDGKVIWINLKVVRVDDEKGDFLYEIAMIEDITEKKMLEKAVQESMKRFRTLFEKSPVGITMSDIDGKIIASNEAYLKIIGYSLDEIKKVSWKEYTYPEDIDKDWNLFKKLINREIDSYSIEKRYIRKDGEIIYARLNCAAVFDENGEFQFEFAIIEDITEEKKVET
jgi:PAS domain S-box-containing protein